MKSQGTVLRRARVVLSRYPTLVLLCLLFTGCSSTRYTAKNLPRTLRAPVVTNAQTVDLSRLAMPVASTDTIGRGDVLKVTISAGLSKDDTVDFPVRVTDEGIATLPDVGELSLEGLQLEEAEAEIVAACVQKQLYSRPNVTVEFERQRENNIVVLGAVKEPGTKKLPRGSSDLLTAIAMAGSLSDEAGTEIEIRNPGKTPKPRRERIAQDLDMPSIDGSVFPAGHSQAPIEEVTTGPETIKVDLVSLATAGPKGYYLEDGAVVMVQKRDPRPVHVMGLVRKPGDIEVPIGKQFRLTDAIARAGGISSFVADKVYIIRQLEHQKQPVVIQVSLRKAKSDGGVSNLLLAEGDTVSVEHTPATYTMEFIRMINFGVGASTTLF